MFVRVWSVRILGSLPWGHGPPERVSVSFVRYHQPGLETLPVTLQLGNFLNHACSVHSNPTLWSLKLRTQQRFSFFHSLDKTDKLIYLFYFGLFILLLTLSKFFFSSLPLQSDSFTWVSPHLPVLYAQVVTSTLSFLTSPSLLAPCIFSLLLLWAQGSSERVHYICSGTDRCSLVHQAACQCCLSWKVKVKLLSHTWLFATPWTVAYQAPPSMVVSRQEYWNGLPFPSPGDLPDPGIEPGSLAL